MRRDKKVKDKHILSNPGGWLAVVEYYRDKPSRDDDTDVEELCETMVEAQKYLSQFPADMWAGLDMSDNNYHEIDERRKNARRKDASGITKDLQDGHPGRGQLLLTGRTFAKLRGRGR